MVDCFIQKKEIKVKLKIVLLTAALYATPTQSTDVSIQFAQQKDIPALTAIHQEVRNEFFKPTMATGYPEYFAHNTEFLDECFNEVDGLLAELFKESTNDTDNNMHILIATDNEEPNKILGLCAFKKAEADSIFIDYLIVSQPSRGKGIGKALLNNALSTYKDINSCSLATLANNNAAVHAFYERCGFTSTKELCTALERVPNTHIMYQLNIKK